VDVDAVAEAAKAAKSVKLNPTERIAVLLAPAAPCGLSIAEAGRSG
jgi:hypothetical protein